MKKQKLIINSLFTSTFVFLFFVASASSLSTNDDILEKIDQYRGISQQMKMHISIINYKKEQSDFVILTEIDYENQKKNTWVNFVSGKNKNRKILMRDFNYWLYIPTSKRSIRITPIQKIMGQTSAGDIANISWKYDYELKNEVKLDNGQIKLTLQAKRKEVTYAKQFLWVNQDYLPIKGELYFTSGKLSKTVEYFLGKIKDREMITTIIFKDAIKKQQTQIIFNNIQEYEINSNRVFNIKNLSKKNQY